MLGSDSWSAGKRTFFGTRPHIWSRSPFPLRLALTHQIARRTSAGQYRGVRLAYDISSQLSKSRDALILVQKSYVDDSWFVSVCRHHMPRDVGLRHTAKHTWPVWFCLSVWKCNHNCHVRIVIKPGVNLGFFLYKSDVIS